MLSHQAGQATETKIEREESLREPVEHVFIETSSLDAVIQKITADRSGVELSDQELFVIKKIFDDLRNRMDQQINREVQRWKEANLEIRIKECAGVYVNSAG